MDVMYLAVFGTEGPTDANLEGRLTLVLAITANLSLLLDNVLLIGYLIR